MKPPGTSCLQLRKWSARGRRFTLGRRAVLAGILNVTPDSFSDGGLYLDADAALAHAERMLAEGADFIDVGGESTRPGAEVVPVDEELRRTLPLVRALAEAGHCVSIDTRKAAVAEAALDAGAEIVNDVSGGNFDPDLLPLVAGTGAGVVLMHMRGTPATMRSLTEYGDLVADVRAELLQCAERARAAGIKEGRIVLDPGIGFAKTPEQNWTLLARLDDLSALDYPLLLGASRKSFLGLLGASEPHERDAATAAALVAGRLAGAALFRVHHVALARQSLDVADRLLLEACP